MTSHILKDLICKTSEIVPKLSLSMHKGSSGKIGVVGGCSLYTGAPYYAALASLRAGADLAFVLCSRGAATPIKCYSPELMVAPWLAEEGDIVQPSGEKLTTWISKLTALVIGPGLGRDEASFKTASRLLEMACERSLPCVVDADGLFLLSQSMDALKLCATNPWCVLTPNAVEIKRLCNTANVESVDQLVDQLALRVLVKGSCDRLALRTGPPGRQASTTTVVSLNLVDGGALDDQLVDILQLTASGSTLAADLDLDCISLLTQPSLRRCGGQGDILSGTLALFLSWAEQYAVNSPQKTAAHHCHIVRACTAASMLTRASARHAFLDHHRASTAVEILNSIGPTFQQLWPSC